MPVRLAVCFVVIGIMVPIVVDAAWDAEDTSSEYALRSEAAGLRSAATEAFYGNGYASAEVYLPAGNALAVGGDGVDAYAVRLLSNGEEIGRLYLENPDIRVIGPETVFTGVATVIFGPASDELGYGVEVLA